jgi:ribonucleotide monophosphatase NagD (HAD superfamily)
MVLTGISTLEEVEETPADLRPDLVAADLPALVAMLEV